MSIATQAHIFDFLFKYIWNYNEGFLIARKYAKHFNGKCEDLHLYALGWRGNHGPYLFTLGGLCPAVECKYILL